VCAQQSEPIAAEDTYGTLASRLEGIAGELLVRVLDERPECAEQDDSAATYADKIEAGDRQVDPGRPASELERRVRALTPHIGAFVLLPDETRLGVLRARAVDGPGPEPGSVSFEGPTPLLGCADGALELLEVQPPGRRSMSGEDYLRGRRH
jgi:methionyl-tRNA formyltransferase